MKFFLRVVCPLIALIIFAGGWWLWLGGTYFESGKEIKSVIVLTKNPESPFMNIFGLYFFLKCTFCAIVIIILSYGLSLKLEKDFKG